MTNPTNAPTTFEVTEAVIDGQVRRVDDLVIYSGSMAEAIARLLPEGDPALYRIAKIHPSGVLDLVMDPVVMEENGLQGKNGTGLYGVRPSSISDLAPQFD